MDFNTIRQQEHLDKCKPYRDGKLSNEPAGLSQQTLPNLIVIMPQTKTDHWKRADITIYMGNLLFNHYENKYIKDHFYYINPKYTLSDYRALSGYILAKCYDIVSDKVERELDVSRWLNFYMDESNNIKKQRVINFLVYAFSGCDIEGGCFYIKSEINGSKTMSAKIQLQFVLRQA